MYQNMVAKLKLLAKRIQFSSLILLFGIFLIGHSNSSKREILNHFLAVLKKLNTKHALMQTFNWYLLKGVD
jgi:hypothetical protein